MAPGADKALAAFADKFPKVVSSASPSYLGTPCKEADLRQRFQALALLVGREEALPLVQAEPLLLAMQEPNLRQSWLALLDVAGGDDRAALQVLRRHPASIIAPASQIREKSLREFEATADVMQSLRPVTDTLQEIGPEGVAMGAAAFGMAALGAMAARKAGKPRPGTAVPGASDPLDGKPRSGSTASD